jgi:chondroitin 4-sulfotransferase 11
MPIAKLPLQLLGLSQVYHLVWWRHTLRKRSVLTGWNERHEAIFVHIPKTAGTSVLAGLGAEDVFDTHAPAQTYRDVYPDFFSRAYRFAFVRNPWDRFASSFHFMKHGTDWPMQQRWARTTIGDLDFAGFTRKIGRDPLFRARVMAERFFWPQTFWLGGTEHSRMIDTLFRFEHLDDAMAQLYSRFGIAPPEQTPHLRRVEKPDFRALYSDDMIAIVGQLYRTDISTLGYRFDT